MDDALVAPAVTCTAAPRPEFVDPTEIVIPPDTPFADVPVPIVNAPLEPLDANPELSVTNPVKPVVARALSISTLPLDVAPLLPLVTTI